MEKKQNQIRKITFAGIIGALYVVLTLVSMAFGLSSGVIQLRLSEIMCILPIFTPYAIPGLTLGCLIANLICGMGVFDIILGTLATLLGAVGTYLFRKKVFVAISMPIISNTLIIPYILYIYGADGAYWYMTLTVAIGETLSAGVCGAVLYSVIKRRWTAITKM